MKNPIPIGYINLNPNLVLGSGYLSSAYPQTVPHNIRKQFINHNISKNAFIPLPSKVVEGLCRYAVLILQRELDR